MTSRYCSETTRNAVETIQDTLGQHRNASGCRKDTSDRYTDLVETHGCGLQIIYSPRMSACRLRNFIRITLQASPWKVVTTGYLDANGYKWGVGSSSLARYNVDDNMDRHDTYLAQLQLLQLEMERQLLIISAQIISDGLRVIRQRRHRRYRFKPWPTWAEPEEECQYSRPMPMHHLDDPMAYRNFIQMPPELCQELQQRINAEFQRDMTLMRDPVSPGVKLAVTLRHLATGDSYTTLHMLSGWPVRPSRSLCLRSVTLSPGPIEIR